MPNWTQNHVTLSHTDSTMIERAVNAFKRGEMLHEFIPVPQALTDTVSGYFGNDTDKQSALEAKQVANTEKYGYANWYDFRVAEHGVKWDIGGDGCQCEVFGDTMIIDFDSAWSPPLQAYEKLIGMGFNIVAYYYEPGECFAGIWDNGDDSCYNNFADSVSAAEMLPADLNEMFNISEQLADNEQEAEDWASTLFDVDTAE